jgi:hypothetical protein
MQQALLLQYQHINKWSNSYNDFVKTMHLFGQEDTGENKAYSGFICA